MKPEKLGIWMVDLTHTQQGIPADTIPYGVGCVASYVQSEISFDSPVRLFRYPEKLGAAIENDELPHIVAFGSFIWNASLQLEIAQRIKALAPETIIVFGGAEFPLIEHEREAYLIRYPVIDFFVNGEGEVTFTELVKELSLHNLDKDKVHGLVQCVFSIDRDGTYYSGGPVRRLLDLSELPSPYLNGVLDEFFDGLLVPILQTNRGCPFKCTFCGVGPDHHNKVVRYRPDHISAELDYIGSKMQAMRNNGGRGDLYIADSNFGMYKQDIPTAHEIARCRKEYNWPEFASVSSGKNSKERVIEVAHIVGGAIRMGGSVQSLDPEVLKNIKRSNISEEELMNLPFECGDADGDVYAETILGLPGDTRDKHFATLRVLVEAGFNLIISHQLRMTKGAELGNTSEQRRFGMKKMFRAYPQSMGKYSIAGEQIVASEIEEICVGNDNFDFADYLECRKRHLIIHLFINHTMYGAITNFIRNADLSVYRWIELICAAPLGGALATFFDNFEHTIRSELWDSEEELRAYIKRNGVIEKFQNGELGFNVLWTYKALGMMTLVSELSELAHNAAAELIRESELDAEKYEGFLASAVNYHTCQLSNLFDDRDSPIEAVMDYDIHSYVAHGKSAHTEDYKLENPTRYKFLLTDEQNDIFDRYSEVFKNTPHGIGRMMAKVSALRIMRNPVAASN